MNLKFLIAAIVIVILAPFAWKFFLTGGKQSANQPANQNQKQEDRQDKDVEGAAKSARTAVFETSFGNIEIALYGEQAPQTAENFAKLVNSGFYDNLTFHRIIPGFVIQGGDPQGDGTGGPGYTVPAEIGLSHVRGAVAMARLPDQVNPERASSGSQFYIALDDLPGLDGQYTVFGQVASGMETADAIAAVETDAVDKPLEDVIINRAYFK